jgi:thiamine pyrophosphokinase
VTPALLLLNGEISQPAEIKRLARDCFVVCTDGGLRHAKRLKITADVVIGDMDSLPKPLPKLRDTSFLCDFDEERSDFDKALAWLQQAGPGEVFIAGALGGRLDHTLVNLALIGTYAKSMPLTLVGEGRGKIVGPGKHTLKDAKGHTFSLLPLGSSAVVSTTGLKYALNKETLRPGSRGLSNIGTRQRAQVHVHSGKIWLIRN